MINIKQNFNKNKSIEQIKNKEEAEKFFQLAGKSFVGYFIISGILFSPLLLFSFVTYLFLTIFVSLLMSLNKARFLLFTDGYRIK